MEGELSKAHPASAGLIYTGTVTLTANDGYVFDSNTDLTVDGNALSQYTSKSISTDGKTMTVKIVMSAKHYHTRVWDSDGTYHWRKCSSCSYTEEKEKHTWDTGTDIGGNKIKYFCTTCGKEITVSTVSTISDIRGSPTWPHVGDLVSDFGIDSVIIGSDSYVTATVTGVEWYEGNQATGTPFAKNAKFKADKNYTLKVTFKAADGYSFNTEKNGRLLPANSIMGTNPTQYYYTYNKDAAYSAADGIDNKVVTGSMTVYAANITTPCDVTVTLPTLDNYIGQTPPKAKVSGLPNSVKLADTWIIPGSLESVNTIEKNKEYYYMGSFVDDRDDSVVSTDIANKYAYNVTINAGDSTNRYFISGAAGGGNVWGFYKTGDPSKIAVVALTVDAPVYDKAPDTSADVPSEAKYTVGTATWPPAVTENKFGEGKYTVSIPVKAKDGYSFADDCTYTVNSYEATYADGKVSHTFPALTTQTDVFADVAAGSYYEKAVNWAVEQGITRGTRDTTFSPDANCTRAQIVTFIWRTLAE